MERAPPSPSAPDRAPPSGARPHRRRAQIGVFGAQAYSRTPSTENVEMGPYPQRARAAQTAGQMDPARRRSA
jgi:hypothetical protein